MVTMLRCTRQPHVKLHAVHKCIEFSETRHLKDKEFKFLYKLYDLMLLLLWCDGKSRYLMRLRNIKGYLIENYHMRLSLSQYLDAINNSNSGIVLQNWSSCIQHGFLSHILNFWTINLGLFLPSQTFYYR